ncbi:hypothetical protein GCM10011376_11760 [Nocardioides flavus (ex Wang et al. 2016)]|uniref:Hydrolase of the HAD superfamily n=1 Tax=Nocardioides flavus (ex Wang et al. 2016) TaxID=2058780 RepID=A0ABQ3HH15_9ACTN|nr:hypothetical protein GCM10011376_11760 [Nocardioides flavus (ex Wang et al. 2016)]
MDRAAAFLAWAEAFCRDHHRDDDEAVTGLVEADADGYTPRDGLAESVRERFRLSPGAFAALVDDLRWGMADHLELEPRVVDAVRRARTTGWTVVIVTNGTVEQQQRKLRLTGLDEEVDACVISEAAGVKKPSPEIFHLAASTASETLEGAWVIGDSARADIAGAHGLSLRSVWLRRGRTWDEEDFAPTLEADDCAQAIDLVIARRPS